MKLRFIIILFYCFSLCSAQLEGYQYIGPDEFIKIDDNNRLFFKLNLDLEGITGFKVAGSGNYRINRTGRKIRVYVDSSIDSLESEYKLIEFIDSDTTSVNLTVIDEQGTPASAVNICYIINNMPHGAITDKYGNVNLKFTGTSLPEYVKVYSLLNVPAYIPVIASKSSYYRVLLKDQSIAFLKSGIIELKVCTNPDLKEIRLRTLKVIKRPLNTCL